MKVASYKIHLLSTNGLALLVWGGPGGLEEFGDPFQNPNHRAPNQQAKPLAEYGCFQKYWYPKNGWWK